MMTAGGYVLSPLVVCLHEDEAEEEEDNDDDGEEEEDDDDDDETGCSCRFNGGWHILKGREDCSETE